MVGLIPTRYPDTDLSAGDVLALARRTDWRETAPGVFSGLGQRLIVTDQAERGLMDVRLVTVEAGAEAGSEVSAEASAETQASAG